MTALILLIGQCGDPCVHFSEVFLNNLDVLAVSDDLEKIIISHEVETGKSSSLGFEVIRQGFLNVGEHVYDASKSLLKALDVHGFDNVGLERNFLHEGGELRIDSLEASVLIEEHFFDVG
jgi:hypothetical protein